MHNEVFTFTVCFEVQVHQVFHLCSGEPQGRIARSPGQTGALFHIQIRILYAKDIFREKIGLRDFGTTSKA